MLLNVLNKSTVEKMVRQFYRVIVKDELVGPYFTKALGNNLNNEKWQEHFLTLDKFWCKLMNIEDDYMDDPYTPHIHIGELYYETFARWLELFHETVHQLFIPEIADKLYKKSERFAKRFMKNLEISKPTT